MSWARVGVKCVCVHDGFGSWFGPNGEEPDNAPVKGGIYTISMVEMVQGKLYLSFAEFSQGSSFVWDAFRPLVSRSDDVALFTHHLDQVSA